MKLTEKRAIEISIEVWEHLRDHPEIQNKFLLPPKLLRKIENCYQMCPLCQFQFDVSPNFLDFRCSGYCLDRKGKLCAEGNYHKWATTPSESDRSKYANNIVKMLKRGLIKCRKQKKVR